MQRERPHLNKLVNNYHLVQFLGEGQFGEVYKACHNKEENGVYAVKIMAKKKIQHSSTHMRLFQAEMNIMKKLSALKNNHHCVKLFDFLETSNNYYLVLEYCNQKDMEQLIKEKTCLSEEQALIFLEQLMDGFKAMHQNNFMHRDFKAANIFIHNGMAKIGDFGFAKEVIQTTNTIIGTPITSAPEVLNKQAYNNKADLWSLAVVYYHMLEGRLPFSASNIPTLLKRQQEGNLTFTNQVSQKSKDFIRKCLVYNFNLRWTWSEAYKHSLFHQTNDNMMQSSIIRLDQLADKDKVFEDNREFYARKEQEELPYNHDDVIQHLANDQLARPSIRPDPVIAEHDQHNATQKISRQEDFEINNIFLSEYLKKYHFLCKSYDRYPNQTLLKLIILVKIKEKLETIIQTLGEQRVVSDRLELKSIAAYAQTPYALQTLQKIKANLVINSQEMDTLIKQNGNKLSKVQFLAKACNYGAFEKESRAMMMTMIFEMSEREQLDILDTLLIDHPSMEKHDYSSYLEEKSRMSIQKVNELVNHKMNTAFSLLG